MFGSLARLISCLILSTHIIAGRFKKRHNMLCNTLFLKSQSIFLSLFHVYLKKMTCKMPPQEREVENQMGGYVENLALING